MSLRLPHAFRPHKRGKKGVTKPLERLRGGLIPFYLAVRGKAQLGLGHVHFPAIDVTYMYLHRELIGSFKYHSDFEF